MKGQMARARARAELGERRIVGGEHALCAIETIDHYPVQAEVRYKQEAAIRREIDRVGVGTFLAARILAGSAVLHERRLHRPVYHLPVWEKPKHFPNCNWPPSAIRRNLSTVR